MKTAISILDPLFEVAEQFAKRMGLSGSELYSIALQEYLQMHKREQIMQQLDAVYADEDSSLDPLFLQLQAQTLSEES